MLRYLKMIRAILTMSALELFLLLVKLFLLLFLVAFIIFGLVVIYAVFKALIEMIFNR